MLTLRRPAASLHAIGAPISQQGRGPVYVRLRLEQTAPSGLLAKLGEIGDGRPGGQVEAAAQ
jgi:hypothetical protein